MHSKIVVKEYPSTCIFKIKYTYFNINAEALYLEANKV